VDHGIEDRVYGGRQIERARSAGAIRGDIVGYPQRAVDEATIVVGILVIGAAAAENMREQRDRAARRGEALIAADDGVRCNAP